MDRLPQRPAPPQTFSESVLAWLAWFGLARLVVTALSVLAVGGGGYWLLRTPATAIEATLPFASTTIPGATTTTQPGPAAGPVAAASTSLPQPLGIVVHIAGAVANPGVYTLPTGSRLHQAISAAGNLLADADANAVNLAALLVDGQRVFIPRIGEAVPAVQAGAQPPVGGSAGGVASGPIDLNRASAEQLDTLPGIGPATAAAIVAHRDQNGPFATADDLLKVRGIGPAKLDAIRALVTT